MRKSITKSAVYILCFILIFLFLAFAYSLSAFAAGSDSIDSIDNVRLSGTLVTGFDVDVTYGGVATNQIVIVWDGSEGMLTYTGASIYCDDSKYAGETPYGGGANMNFALAARPDITGSEKTYFIGLYEVSGTVLVQRANTTITVGNSKVVWNGVTLYTYVAPVDPVNNNDRVETTYTFSESDWIDEQVLKIILASGSANPNVTFDYSSTEYAVPNAVMKALLKYSDVSLTIHTSYQGENITSCIHAGTAVDDEIPWYGPLYLKGRYPTN